MGGNSVLGEDIKDKELSKLGGSDRVKCQNENALLGESIHNN
jgi:hypothetical protein